MKRNRGYTLIEIMIATCIVLLAMALINAVFNRPGDSIILSSYDFSRLMKQEGIQDAVNTGYKLYGCAEGDTVSVGFRGVKNDTPVNGVICGGLGPLGKAYTIRTF